MMTRAMIFPSLWYDAVDQLPLGLLLLDATGRVRSWNGWLEAKTEIAQQEALGKTLAELFPGFDNPRFELAVVEVFASGSPQLLSPALNHFIIPIPLGISNRYGLEWMQQKVQVTALTAEDGTPFALISIMDASEYVLQTQALAEAARSLQESSNRDSLTGLYNRRFMQTWLEHELTQVQRHRYPIACLLLDIDHFKHINDTFGHSIGDEVLQGFARVLEPHIRDSDLFVRYGGEEFVVLLSRCTLPMAIARAHKLVEVLRGAAVAVLPTGAVTCSVGVAVQGVDDISSAAALLQAADEQLYAAKRAGRDRVSPSPT